MPIYKTKERKNGIYKYRVRVAFTTLQGEHKQIERVAWGIDNAKDIERQLINTYAVQQMQPSSMTVNRLVELYLENHKADTRATTHEKTKRTITAEVLPCLGHIKLSALDKRTCELWKKNIGNKDVSVTTKNNIFATFNAVLNYGVRMDYLPKNPLAALGRFKDTNFTATHKELQYYTPEEFRVFIAKAREMAETKQDYRCFVFFSIAFYTGMRKGEINALKWSDIKDGTICIRRSVSQKIKGIRGFESPPKNKSSIRDVKMPSALIEILNEHKKRQQNFYLFNEGWNICGGEDYLPDTVLDDTNREIAKATGLHHIRIHDFRHSHASVLCNNGVNIQAVAKRLGHADVRETWNTYSHLYPEEEDRAVALLDDLGIM